MDEFEDFGGGAVGHAEGGQVVGASEEELWTPGGVELGGLVVGAVGGDAVGVEFYLDIPSGEELGVACFAPSGADVFVEDAVKVAAAGFPITLGQPRAKGEPLGEDALVDGFIKDVAGLAGDVGGFVPAV